MHGLSKAVETLYNSELNQEFEFEKVDITNNKKFFSNLIAIRKSKADLFYFTISQTRGGNLRDLMILRAIGKRPCLVHLHGGYYRTMVEQLPKWQKNANYKAIGKLAGAIVLGPSLKWIFQGMITDEKIFTVPNCIDDEYLMSDHEFEKKIASIEKRKIKHVLYLSNFIRTKGYPEVLELAKHERNRVKAGGEKKIHFDFAGKFFEKSEEDFFWKYVKNNELEDFISYHGVVGGDKKRELLDTSDIFVLLTTYPNEGQPISILEAMGNGMVIVSTDHAGIPDIVSNDINGIIVEKNDIEVDKIYGRLSAFFDYENVERKNRNTVIKKFNQARYVDEMKMCFDKCMLGN
jgi:glycosyltransferase involved in cell wall biosynthesis